MLEFALPAAGCDCVGALVPLLDVDWEGVVELRVTDGLRVGMAPKPIGKGFAELFCAGVGVVGSVGVDGRDVDDSDDVVCD